MSLTREQWTKMWEDVKVIENSVKYATEMSLVKRQRILNKVEAIKENIQSVIGQMG